MALLGIDELNTPKVEVEEPKKYFSKMAISKEQKEERVDTANDIMDVLLFFFALLAIEMQENNPDYDMVLRKFRVRFADVVASHSRMDDHQNAYVDEFTQNQFDITRRHMEAVGVGVDGQTDAGWWTSPDRATAIGEDAANSILNYEELIQAIENGYTKKMWVTERDNRVRKTHTEVDGKTIPITEFFVVGNAAMMLPHDPGCLEAREVVNCRCSLKYLGKGKKTLFEKENPEEIEEVDTSVNYSRLSDERLKERLSVLGETEEVTDKMVSTISDMLEHRNGTRLEDLIYINSDTNESLVQNKASTYIPGVGSEVQPTAEMMEMLKASRQRSVIGIHNHPASGFISGNDGAAAAARGYKYGLVIGHNGDITKYYYNGKLPAHKIDLFDIKRTLDKFGQIGYNTINETEEELLKKLKELDFHFEDIP